VAPEISRFFGIIIRIYFNDHHPPHFHAAYGDSEALIAIETLEMMKGEIPRDRAGARGNAPYTESVQSVQSVPRESVQSVPRESVPPGTREGSARAGMLPRIGGHTRPAKELRISAREID